MTPTYRTDTETFTYHNENPKHLKSAGDCVIRAIAYATRIGWDETLGSLYKIGFKMKRLPNDDKVFEQYLSNLGYSKQSQPRKPDNTKYTVKEFAKKYPKGTYIVRMAGHLSVVDNGKIIDTWNCGYKCVGNYWKIR